MSQLESRRKWDEVIFFAREVLARVEAKAQRLKTDIHVMEESRDCGDEYGEESGDEASA